jgi:predicted DNA-binding transcriptional regulator YafY
VRASRLVSLLLLLQTRGRTTAAELARELEVSERTIHRDVDALSASGVPIYAERGPHGGVQLVEGYRTRLTGMTAEEAEALFLSGLAGPAGPAAELGLGTVIAAAQLKVLAALPGELRARASRLVERFYLDAATWFQRGEPVNHLPTVAQAVWDARRLRINYDRGDAAVERLVEPLGLVLKGGVWYFVGRVEEQLRTYRVSRVQSAALTEESFDRPVPFDLPGYWQESIAAYERDAERSELTLRVAPHRVPELADLFGDESLLTAVRLDEDDTEGWTRLRISVRWPREAGWRLIGLGRDVEVLDPPEVRTRLVRLARAALERHAPTGSQ